MDEELENVTGPRKLYLVDKYTSPYREKVYEIYEGFTEDNEPTGIRRLIDISAARCAWTSYWPVGDDKPELQIEKVKRTILKLKGSTPIHASPFEHQCTPAGEPCMSSDGNLQGFIQYRKAIPQEKAIEYNPSDEEIASWGLS